MWSPFRVYSLLVVLESFSHGAVAARNGHCPPLGPVLPVPLKPSTHPAVQAAVASFTTHFRAITANFASSAVSFGIKSSHESNSIVELHHTPPALDPRGKQTVDSDSVYRLASVSKVFAVLATLKLKGVALSDPITKYVPELRGLKDEALAQSPVYITEWDEITLGALAAHLADIAADFMTDLTLPVLGVPGPSFGFPNITEADGPGCSIGEPECTWQHFFARFGRRPPVYATYTTPVYSNIGTTLLGLVVERVSGQNYSVFLQEQVLGPLGMERTFYSKPDDKLGVIPTNDTWWDYGIGFEGPSGQMYSSITDLLTFGSGILSNKVLSPAQTRSWLKPWTHTQSDGTMIGAPWEIFRTNNATKDQRWIEFYTKGGSIFTYQSTLAVVPDYDLSIAILVAGPEAGALAESLLSDAAEYFLPAIETAGKDDARAAYAGTYTDANTNSTVTLSIAAGDDAPGLSVTNYFVRGVDIINTYPSLGGGEPHDPPPEAVVTVRAYSTNLASDNQTSWRIMFDALQAPAPKSVFPQSECISWGTVDRLVWGLQAMDLFIFDVDKTQDGAVASGLSLPAYRVHLTKQGAPRR